MGEDGWMALNKADVDALSKISHYSLFEGHHKENTTMNLKWPQIYEIPTEKKRSAW